MKEDMTGYIVPYTLLLLNKHIKKLFTDCIYLL